VSFTFRPATVHVKVGGRVTWANRDSAAHTATADQGPTFDTGTLKQGQRKTVTFAIAGTFTYHCAFHAFMKGTVTVG
jgi:plastocyanin